MSKPIPRDLAGRALLEALNGHAGASSSHAALDELARFTAAPPAEDPAKPSPALERKLKELAERAERAERKLAELTATLAADGGGE